MALDTIPKQEGGKLKAVASGTLPSGKPVVVNADGTVSVAGETSVTQAVGSSVVFASSGSTTKSSTFDSSNNKVVIVYRDTGNSSYGTAVIGTINDTSVTFGTPVVFESAQTDYLSVTFDEGSSKVVVAYRDGGNSGHGTAIVGTVSGTSISFGSPVVFKSADTYVTTRSIVYDASAQKVVIVYVDDGNSFYGTAIVGTVSGTSISFGSATVFEANNSALSSITYDPVAEKVVVAYSRYTVSYGIVGTVSGTSISFGSRASFESANATGIDIAFDTSSSKVVISYQDEGNSNYGTCAVGNVSGTSITFGTPVVFESAYVAGTSIAFDSAANKIVVSYRNFTDSNNGTIAVGTVSGTSITFDTPLVFDTGSTTQFTSAFDSSQGRTLVSYEDSDNSNYGTSVVFRNAATVTNLTSENYIGMSGGGSVADGGNANVGIVGSVSDEQSGLTAGQQYYVQTDGTLSETPADPSVLAGTAISATKMLVKT